MNVGKQELFIGMEIGGTKLQMVTACASAKVVDRVRYPIDAAAGAKKIRQQIQEGVARLMKANKIEAIGVGFGGPVDWKKGTIQLSHQVKGWGNFELKSWLEQMAGLPVAIDNDANTAALAEAKYGAGKNYNTVFYMTIGSGIGGGLVIDEKIYHGRIPGEVEIGHVRLDKSGATLEERCSGWAVNKKVRQHIHENPFSLLSILAQKSSKPEAHLLKPALEEGDADSLKLIDEIADDISFALSHVIHLMNPEIIVIGGGLSLLGENLLRPLLERLPQYLMEALLPLPPVNIAALNEDVVPIGAIELAKSAHFSYKPKTIH